MLQISRNKYTVTFKCVLNECRSLYKTHPLISTHDDRLLALTARPHRSFHHGQSPTRNLFHPFLGFTIRASVTHPYITHQIVAKSIGGPLEQNRSTTSASEFEPHQAHFPFTSLYPILILFKVFSTSSVSSSMPFCAW